MKINSEPLPRSAAYPTDQNGLLQYTPELVSRWDALIDWNRRAALEKTFFSDLLLKQGACRIFDAATGTGFHAVQLRRAGFEVIANDGSPDMVKKARDNFASRGLNIPTACLDWRTLYPRDLGRFDAVLCLGNSLCHLYESEQRIQVLERFRALLKPGGLLLIDQCNFPRLLSGDVVAAGRHYYCANATRVTLGTLNESECEFVYTFGDEVSHTLRVCPVLPGQLRHEMRAAGFVGGKSFGDFQHVWDPLRADFIVHHGLA